MASDIKSRSSEFSRILAKGTIGKRDVENVPFLHFESLGDRNFFKKFVEIWNKLEVFGSISLGKHQFVFTRSKKEAINAHRKAVKGKIHVSTLVDMDHDVASARIGKTKFIHSTKPACTLHTIQFLDGENGLNKSHLLRVIRDQGEFSNKQCDRIIERAVRDTLVKLEGPSSDDERVRLRKALPHPLNDHMLARSIAIELGHTEYGNHKTPNGKVIFEIENRIAAQSITDPNERLRNLAKAMFEDLKQGHDDIQ